MFHDLLARLGPRCTKQGTHYRDTEWILLYVAFCTIMAISRQKEARSPDYSLLLFRMTSRVLYSAYTIGSTVHSMPWNSLEHCIYNHDDKHLARPGLEPGISRLQASVDKHEPSEHYQGWRLLWLCDTWYPVTSIKSQRTSVFQYLWYL